MDDEHRVAVTAFIAALVEGVRLLGPRGVNEDQLYASVAKMASRKAFDMVVAELIEQKTFKRIGPYGLVYCGPCMVQDEDQDEASQT